MHYRKYKERGIISHIHIWYGRSLILLGIVDGGLGLWLAEAPPNFIVVYCVAAGLVTPVYILSVVFSIRKKKLSRKSTDMYLMSDSTRYRSQ